MVRNMVSEFGTAVYRSAGQVRVRFCVMVSVSTRLKCVRLLGSASAITFDITHGPFW